MTEPRFVRERFSAAVSVLAESRGRIKERVLDAYRLQVAQAIKAPGGGLSPEFRRHLQALHRRMTAASGADQEARVAATVAAMSEEQAVDVAREIVYLAWEVTNEVAGEGA